MSEENKKTMQEVVLEFPIEYNGNTFEVISFPRRARARDYFGAMPSKLTFFDTIKIISKMTGQIVPVLERLDMKDFVSLNEVMNDFIGTIKEDEFSIDEFPIVIPLRYPIDRNGKTIDSIEIERRPKVMDYKNIVITAIGFEDTITIVSNISNMQFTILKEMDVSDMMRVSGIVNRFL